MIKSTIEDICYRAFASFKENYPKLERICDEETLGYWLDFITYCYALNVGQDVFRVIDETLCVEPINLKFSELMEEAAGEAVEFYLKYNLEVEETSFDYFPCEECDGEECETCNGLGYDADQLYSAIDNAYLNVKNKINIYNFKKLTNIIVQ